MGFYASWAGNCNINYLQISASVRAGQATINFSS